MRFSTHSRRARLPLGNSQLSRECASFAERGFIFSGNLWFPENIKSLIVLKKYDKGRVSLYSRFHPDCFGKTTHYDYNGITGPDWGHSEVVFKCFRQGTHTRRPLSVTFHILLFSSTCCLRSSNLDYNTDTTFVNSKLFHSELIQHKLRHFTFFEICISEVTSIDFHNIHPDWCSAFIDVKIRT